MKTKARMLAVHVTLVGMFIAVFGAILGMLPAGAMAGDPVTVLSWPNAEGTVGEQPRLTLSIADANGIQAATIDIKYDPGKVAPITTTLERESFGMSIVATWGASTPADSTLRLAFFTASEDGYVGGGPWVSIEWALIDSGESPIHFDEIVLEREPNLILPASGVDGSITVAPLPVLPESWGSLKHRYHTVEDVSEGP